MNTELRAYLRRTGRHELRPGDWPVDLSWTAPLDGPSAVLTKAAVAAPPVALGVLLAWLLDEPGWIFISVVGGFAMLVLMRVNPKGWFDFLYRRSHARLDADGVGLALAGPDGTLRRASAAWSEYTMVRRAEDRWTEEVSASRNDFGARRAGARWVKTVARSAAVIEIVHPDDALSIPVWFGGGGSRAGGGGAPDPSAAPRGVWEGWAKALALPAVDRDGTRRAPEALDATVADRVAGGELPDLWSADAPPPPELRVERTGAGDGEAFEVTVLWQPPIRVDALMLLPALIGAGIAAAGVALWVLASPEGGAGLVLFGTLFVLIGLARPISRLVVNRERPVLRIARDEISQTRGRPLSGVAAGAVPTRSVEEVTVVRAAAGGEAVRIVSDAGELTTMPAPPHVAAWLRDFLVSAIAAA